MFSDLLSGEDLDSRYQFYRVEVLHPSGKWGDWKDLYSREGAPVPRIPVRYSSEQDARNANENEPFRSFSASGKCWQLTGIEGTFDVDVAHRLVDLLLEYNPGLIVRVVKVVLQVATRVVGTYQD